MKPEDQRIAISEALGIKHFSDCALHNEPAYPNGPCDCGRLPDYLGDLNAIHQATTENLTFPETILFVYHLQAIGQRNKQTLAESVVLAVEASAAERCEAFLRTKSLWVDTP